MFFRISKSVITSPVHFPVTVDSNLFPVNTIFREFSESSSFFVTWIFISSLFPLLSSSLPVKRLFGNYPSQLLGNLTSPPS
ncbi:hypothetical protein OVS_04285 [Mycoplasma ovis str. Michigan]|uniref:Uncharacterized protein n=1 Tax=Mycoplasma ovis str. Michigan TaxID=1415773 RepID=A0ABM5P2I2_9MOLU|nr:hypothetical protein OVS_04285 [Mycoplasma ovis str. Michigan]